MKVSLRTVLSIIGDEICCCCDGASGGDSVWTIGDDFLGVVKGNTPTFFTVVSKEDDILGGGMLFRFIDTGESEILDVGDNDSFEADADVELLLLLNLELAALPIVKRVPIAFFCILSGDDKVKLNLVGVLPLAAPLLLATIGDMAIVFFAPPPALDMDGGLNEKSSSSTPIFNFTA